MSKGSDTKDLDSRFSDIMVRMDVEDQAFKELPGGFSLHRVGEERQNPTDPSLCVLYFNGQIYVFPDGRSYFVQKVDVSSDLQLIAHADISIWYLGLQTLDRRFSIGMIGGTFDGGRMMIESSRDCPVFFRPVHRGLPGNVPTDTNPWTRCSGRRLCIQTHIPRGSQHVQYWYWDPREPKVLHPGDETPTKVQLQIADSVAPQLAAS